MVTVVLDAAAPDAVDIVLLYADAHDDEVRRHRISPVEAFRALVHGHFVAEEVERLANRWNIHTGAGVLGRNRLCIHTNSGRNPIWIRSAVQRRINELHGNR